MKKQTESNDGKSANSTNSFPKGENPKQSIGKNSS